MSPHLPVTAREIEEAAVGAVEAGAAIVHLHARDPKDGRPSQEVALFRDFVGNIKRRTQWRDQPHDRRRADDDRARSACSRRCS